MGISKRIVPNRGHSLLKRWRKSKLQIRRSEEDYKEDNHTLTTPDVGDLLVIRRALHAKEVPLECNQKEKMFHTHWTVRRKVCELIIHGSYTNVASTTLIDKLQVPTKVIPPLILFDGSSKGRR